MNGFPGAGKFGGDDEDDEKDAALRNACGKADVDEVVRLLQSGANLAARDKSTGNQVMLAARYQRPSSCARVLARCKRESKGRRESEGGGGGGRERERERERTPARRCRPVFVHQLAFTRLRLHLDRRCTMRHRPGGQKSARNSWKLGLRSTTRISRGRRL